MALGILTGFIILTMGRVSCVIWNNSNRPECNTEVCRKTADKLLSYVHINVSACDNFYGRVCGGWKDQTIESETIRNQFYPEKLKIEKQLRVLLEEEISSSDLEAVRKAKTFYRSCLNLGAMEHRGLKPIEDILKAHNEWPLMNVPIDQKNSKDMTWLEIHESIYRTTGVSALFDLEITKLPGRDNRWNTQINFLHNEHLYKQFRFSSPLEKGSYRRFIVSVVKALSESRGIPVDETKLDKDVFNMFKLQENLNKHMQYEIAMSIADIQGTWDLYTRYSPVLAVNWLDLIKRRFADQGITFGNPFHITILVPQLHFIEYLVTYIMGTDLPTIVNYIHWTWIKSMLKTTNQRMRDMESRYDVNLNQKQHERAMQCVLNHPMKIALSYLWERRHSNQRYNQLATEMAVKISEEFERVVDHNTWLNDKAKESIRKRLHNITYVIGYPDWHDNVTRINEIYSLFPVGPDYFENVINSVLYMRRELPRTSDLEMDLQPFENSARYYLFENKLYVTAATVLQFFNPELPAVLNFARLGRVLAEGIIEAFDTIFFGIGQDNTPHAAWLPHEQEQTYKKRAMCFIEQYDKYRIIDHRAWRVLTDIDGWKTLNENMGTSSAISLALRTYKNMRYNGNLTDVTISGVKHLTDTQLFFYGVANSLCESSNPQYLLERYEKENKPSSQMAIDGSFSNMRRFAVAFRCPVDSNMNPDKKCSIWDI